MDSGNNAAELLAENEKLRKALSQRLQQLEEIRDASLTWAMACHCHCPGLRYDVRDDQGVLCTPQSRA